jgi:O-methyltransferase involved in polyketide biosynthesis
MKPNEPSRTALMIARQRAAHQLLDRGSILSDPFAMKILREDEKNVLQFANAPSWPASDVSSPPREAGLPRLRVSRETLANQSSEGDRR